MDKCQLVIEQLLMLRKIARSVFYKLPLRLRFMLQSIRRSGVMVVGHGSYIHPSVHLLGKDSIRIGSSTCVSEGSWLNVNHKEVNGAAIVIGDNCFIGKRNFFTSGDCIFIGDYTLTTIGCKFIGSTHKFDNPEVPYLSTGTTSEDKIVIGTNCFFGANATVLGNVKVGHGSIIGADSLVLKDVPPFSIMVGNPAKLIKRYSFARKSWLNISAITADDYIGMPDEQSYLELLKSRFRRIDMPWIAAGKSMGDL